MNIGIKVSLSQGYNWIINMDHDDYFSKNHLNEIVDIIRYEDPVFVCSKSTFEKSVLPKEDSRKFIPRSKGLIKSSACVDFSVVNLLFRDVYEEEGRDYPSDADFWNRLEVVIKDNKYQSFCTGKLTCFHDEEGYAIKN